MRRGGPLARAAALALCGAAGCVRATATGLPHGPAPARSEAEVQAASARALDSIQHLPGYRPAHDTVTLLAPARLARLPDDRRAAWAAYVARSHAVHARDTASMNAELRAAGRTTMERAPYAHDFAVADSMTAAWFRTPAARAEADVMLSFQAPNGGWSKHVDFTRHPRRVGQSYYGESESWGWISTFDNSSTTEEVRFLALADRERPSARYREAATRGVAYVLDAQMPSGCWPQSFPLEGSYHDAATFNDGVTVLALRLVRDAARGDFAFLPAELRARAARATEAGVACVLDAQVRERGALTAWGQQHDPLTLAPASARSYELASLSGLESVGVVDFLMEDPSPSARVVESVHAAAAWFRRVAITGMAYDSTMQLRPAPGAPTIWARLYELDTDRPIFANRDGVTLYDSALLTDRRRGYGWYSQAAGPMLARYDAWASRHPRGAGAP